MVLRWDSRINYFCVHAYLCVCVWMYTDALLTSYRNKIELATVNTVIPQKSFLCCQLVTSFEQFQFRLFVTIYKCLV